MNSRRSFLGKSLLALSSGLITKNAFAKGLPQSTVDALPSLKGRKILFTYGGWDGHEPEKFLNFLKPWMQKEGAEVMVYDNLSPYEDESIMNQIDLIVQVFTMSSITKEQEAGLLKAVKNGAGMAGWHGGMCDAFRPNTEYQFMTGGQWVAHPGGVIEYKVNIIDHDDPVTNGLKDFAMHSEQYYMHVDPNVKVMATTTFNGDHSPWIDGCTMPVCWKKMYGKGRIFYTSLGHNLDHVTTVPDALKIIQRGIQWASASKYQPAEKWISPMYAKQ
ncbi:ThuA domain-containing protein [Fulvivirga ligni]|uniref:ThuA domain-containing protein n=1 Tax=Fulvivirga ligni TaxID=2904246 RepID=UPI001F3B5D9A|nr:ThuA domain-containing protein [Fulvivirga ligni]UII21476.1 ThuA domain-containing protein [Fulvivirga ligni]